MKKFNTIPISALTRTLQMNYKVHFLRGPSSDQIFTPFEQKQLVNIITQNQKEDSYQIFNPQKTLLQINNWRKQLDWINPYYAIKANPSLAQLEIMKKQNVGFDCASLQEIATVLSLNVNPNKIILSNSIKKVSDLEFARQNGVNLTTADTIDELHKIRAHHPQCEILWRIAIPELQQSNLATTFSHKFGDDLLTSKQMSSRFQEIKSLGINLSGLHFHCGSGASGSQNFSFALDIAQECIKIGKNNGHNMRVLDLGGGFPAGAISKQFCSILERVKGVEKVMAEPGRHFASNSFSVVCHVIGKRIKSGHVMYHINDSLYHMMNCVLMDGMSIGGPNTDWYSKWDKNGQDKLPTQFESGTIVGMTCDGMDIIAKNIKLPRMEVGDAIVINGMGAYTSGAVSKFNGMKVTEQPVVWEPEVEMPEEAFKGVLREKLELCF